MTPSALCITNRKGAVLILTFLLMVTLTIIAAAYLFLVTSETRNASAQANDQKALYLAEAGLNKAVWYLMNTEGSSWRTTPYPADPGEGDTDPQQESLGEGTYTMWVEDSGGDILVTARGTVAGIQRVIQQTITLTSAVSEVFNDAQYAGGDIDYRDSSGTITGDLNTAGTVNNESGMTITGSTTESSGVAVPSVDMASYASIAGTTVSGNQTFSAGTYSGIWYIDGKATIQDNVTFNGTIVATGNIVLKNTDNFTSTPSSNYPALVTASNITGNKIGTAVINGLVFAEGSISLDQGSNNTVNGSMISGGNTDMKKGSGWSVVYDADLAADPPPYFSAGSAGAAGSGWKEL